MTTNYFTPYQDGITQYKALHMNAPLEELDEAIGGSVVGPDANTDGSIPQWDGADSKTLKDGLSVVTSVGSPGADTSIPTEKAVRSALSGFGDGDVAGPESSTDNAVTRFDGTDGKTVQSSLVTVDDSGSVNIPSGQTYKINGEDHTHPISGGVGICFEATAKPVANGEYSFLLPYAMTIAANCSGSSFYNKTNPSAEVVVSIKQNGTEFATLTVSSGGSPIWAATETELVSGDRISFVFPAQNSTLAGVVITLRGERS